MNDDNAQGKSIEERIALATSTPDTAGEPSVITENQPEPMPSSDQKQTEEVIQTETAPDQTVEDDLTLPEGVTERTRQQFEKLKARLAEAEAKAKTEPNPSQAQDFGTSVFDSFRPQQTEPQPNQVETSSYGFLNQQQVDSITSQFVDADGNVDINGLNQALNQANQRAAQAEQRVAKMEDKLERMEETQQVKEAHAVFPQLEPGTKDFDPKFFELVKDRLLRNMYEGKKQSLLEVANAINSAYKPTSPVNLDKVKEEAVAQYKESQENRNQGPIESGKGEDRNPLSNLEELRKQTRSENPLRPTPALDERLKAAGILKS